MGMFGRSQRASFKPSVYQPGKRSRRMPRWLVLLLVGIAIGAGGVLFLQANYGPQRLTVEQSETLHSDLSAANVDRQRLQSQLTEATQQRDAARTGGQQTTTDLATARKTIESLQADVKLFMDSVPPDPRGGPIGVRAADLAREPGQVNYKILIMRDDPKGAPFEGTIELAVQGRYTNGRTNTLTSEPIKVKLDKYEQLSGQMAVPANFTSRQVTIRVLDGAQRQQAMRIYNLR